jgi:hypothetical protein
VGMVMLCGPFLMCSSSAHSHDKQQLLVDQQGDCLMSETCKSATRLLRPMLLHLS